jgi:hypothetical protein
MKNDTFTLPGPISSLTPFEQLHVWQWSKDQPRDDVKVANYLKSVGFVLGRDKLNPEDLKTLDYAIEHFHRVMPHMVGPVRLDDVLTPSPDGSGFYVHGKSGRYLLSETAKSALADAGWIYEVNPDTTYFQVTNGKLWAKYQQIIGSRPIVEISE